METLGESAASSDGVDRFEQTLRWFLVGGPVPLGNRIVREEDHAVVARECLSELSALVGVEIFEDSD